MAHSTPVIKHDDRLGSLAVRDMFPVTLDSYACLSVVFLGGLLFLARKLKQRSKLPYPPSPKGLFLLGNIFDVPVNREWVTYADWSRQFGAPTNFLSACHSNSLTL